MNLKSPPLTPDPIPHAPISMVPSIMSYVKFNGKTPHSQRVRRRQTKEPPKKTQEPSAIRPGEGSDLVNTILGIFSTIQKLDVLCYTCLNHIFIRFQYSSQLLKKEQTLRLHTDPATKSLSRAFSCVQHLYYKPDIFCITKLSTLFPHLPLFHIIGASAQSLEELIQTFRCHRRAEKRSNLTIRGQNTKSLCWEENMFLFLSQIKIWGESKLCIQGAIFFLRILHLAPKLLNVIKLYAPQTPRAPLLSELYFDIIKRSKI